MNEQDQFPTMSEREKYLFDLQGFIVVRGLLSTAEVKRLNEAVDANLDKHSEHTIRAVGPQLEGKHLRGHISGMLTWEHPWCQPFRDLLAHPKLIPYLNTLLGRGWKLDHAPDILTATAGTEGLSLHGDGNVTFNGSRFYAYQNGRMRCGLINCQFYMTDVNPRRWRSVRHTGQPQSEFTMSRRHPVWEATGKLSITSPFRLEIWSSSTKPPPTVPFRGRVRRATHRALPLYPQVPPLSRWLLRSEYAGVGL